MLKTDKEEDFASILVSWHAELAHLEGRMHEKGSFFASNLKTLKMK